MTKRILLVVAGASLCVAFVGIALAQGTRGTAKLELNGKAITIDYGRPALKGRTETQLLERLKPGDFWRLGANKSTTFASQTDLSFGSVKVPAGQYSLWAQRTDNGWKLVFNKQHGQWGTEHDPTQDFASVPLKEMKASNSEEMVTLTLANEGSGGVLSIQWGHMKLTTDFTAA